MHVISEATPNRAAVTIYLFRECREFLATCPECGQEHSYGRLDVRQETVPNQPLGFLNESFARATAPLPAKTPDAADGKQ